MTEFDVSFLRTTPWTPTFTWVATTWEAADRINSFHEDYPARVGLTFNALENLGRKLGLTGGANMWPLGYKVPSSRLFQIHSEVFGDTGFAGRWRDVQVRIGPHVPPAPDRIQNLVTGFLLPRRLLIIEDLEAWYLAFETIHPFQDGNGRVGGIIVAAYAHHFTPEMGWLAPNQ